VMGAESDNVSSFCSDDGGFSIAAVDEADGLNYNSYGWAAQVTSGTRTINSNGTVTWVANHQGNSVFGPAGSVTLDATAPGNTCPISPYSVTGPEAAGNRSMTVTATYDDGLLQSMNISNASLNSAILGTGGLVALTMNVSTTSGASPSSSNFIVGTISASKTTLASFQVDAFGDGTLSVVSDGISNTFVITDWHPMHNPNANI
jgi:hypothetical protein